MIDRHDPLAHAIQAELEDDLAHGAKLMLPRYRPLALAEQILDGYCAVGAAAYFFIGGGLAAGLQPMQLTLGGSGHWWIAKRGALQVVDLILRRNESPGRYPYERGRPRGFMQTGYKRPSKRAAELIRRVERARSARSGPHSASATPGWAARPRHSPRRSPIVPVER